MTSQNILTRKLELFGHLPAEDRRLLDDVISQQRRVTAKSAIIREGDSPTDVHLVLEGFACRSKTLQGGSRQIFAYLVPGDFCDLNVFILKAMDHDIETLSPCTVVDIPRQRILEMGSRPELARSLWWATLVDEATLREWIVNIGQREAEERVGHLFCEVHLRLKSIGLTTNGRFEMPITQAELADTMGMSAVHMNRSLQSLRTRGLIELKSSSVVIPDTEKLEEFAEFNPNYLHLERGKEDHPH